MGGIVAIVGRPNVGKSTLFNRLVERRDAIVDSSSGVTRDRNYGKSFWNGRYFSIIDTGGYVTNGDDAFEKEIEKQIELAIEESDVILFMLDVSEGITPADNEVFRLLRCAEKPIMTVVNKVDNSMLEHNATEFYSLGIDKYYTISGINGSGTGDLLDDLIPILPEDKKEDNEDLPRFAIVGRPNVGKSSFINTLIGQERYIVTDVAGTTRDSNDSYYNQYELEFNLVDTAGIRKKSKVKENVEFYSVMRSVRSIENSDVCVLLIDAARGFESQDSNIFWLAARNKKGLIILVNKWDLVDKNTNSTKEFEKHIRQQIKPFVDVPIVFVSVLEKQRLLKAMKMAVEVYENRARRVPTKKLNNIMLPIIEAHPAPSNKGKYIKIKFCTQLPTNTPQFVFFANLPQYIKEPYKKFLENKLRKYFNFNGVPIQIYVRKK